MARANAAVQAQQNQQGADELCRLERFQRNNPPTFKGRYDLEGAQTWLQRVEKIFRAMVCYDAHKVLFGTHMLAEEAEYCWENACYGSCWIYDEDSRVRSTHKSVNEKGKGQDRGKFYGSPADKGKKKVACGSEKSGGDMRCFKCGRISYV
ncbi:cellular nucleic acid-binding protein [Trifolium pratense]|uniref:Cellular nucleic acid-binding protein n=1 Tax=Trifolium pratense TaxID=57577 RepID=A0A2K3LBQ5_TRIPR|nr:cellular nucleic acid-binding protein [Trifolium pratense]